MKSTKNGKQKIHTIGGDNVINFPKPSAPSSSSSEKDVESGARYTIHFEPDWNTDEDDTPDSTA